MMRKYLLALVCLCSVSLFGQSYTTVTASNLQDASGNLIPSAQLCFAPVAAPSTSLTSFHVGSSGLAVNTSTSCYSVTNGVLQSGAKVADSNYTAPLYVAYKIVLIDNLTGKQYALGTSQISCGLSPTSSFCSGGSWSLDNYQPVVVPLAVVQLGPKGDKGDTGDTGAASVVDGSGVLAGSLKLTDGSRTGTHQIASLTANRTYTWPDESGSVMLDGPTYQLAHRQAGADASEKLNACISQVLSADGGTCDARGLGGSQTISQQVTVGDGTKQVTLLMPVAFNWQMSGITNGTSCGLKVMNNASIIGTATGGSSKAQITAASGVNADAMVCTDPAPSGSGSYVRIEGFMLYNTNGATFAHGLLNAQHLYDNSKVRGMTIANYTAAGTGLRVYDTCCTVSFDDVTAQNNHTGGNVVSIEADASTRNFGVSFNNLSAGHAGTGYSEVQIIGGGTAPTDAVNNGITFNNLYTEFGTGVTSALKIRDARNVMVNGWTVGVIGGGAGSKGLDLDQSASGQVQSIIVNGYKYNQPSGSYGIYNNITGEYLLGATAYQTHYEYGGSQPDITANVGHYWKNAAGNTVFQFAMDGGLVLRNWVDGPINVQVDSGSTAQQVAAFMYRDRGVNKWQSGKGSSNEFAVSDAANSFLNRLRFIANGTTDITSGAGANAVLVNALPNSGTAGLEVWSGGTTPVKVIGIAPSNVVKATTGTRFLCIDTNGNMVSQTSACSGT